MQKQFTESLKREIDIVSNEVSDFLHLEDVFQTRVKARFTEDNVDNYSRDTIIRNHYTAVLLAVRRQLGKDKNEVSLLRILKKLEAQNNLITQEWYTTEWLRGSSLLASATAVDPRLSAFVKSIPIREFEDHFGKGGILNKSIVTQEIVLLELVTDKIKTYVDKRLAHRDKTSPKDVTEKEYVEALNTIEKLTSKYILLLKQVGMSSLKPVIQG